VLANASVGLNASNDSFEAQFRVGYDQGTNGDDRTDRYVDAYPDSSKLTNGDGTDRGVAITAFYTVTAGTHTINFLYRRTEGSVAVKVYNPSLNVLFVPDTSDLQLCGQMLNAAWTNSTGSLSTTVKCTLNLPTPGLVFVSADGWMALPNAGSPRYTAAHEIYLNNTNGGQVAVRYTDVLTNTGDGVDAVMAATQVFNVPKGTQELSLVFRREGGTGAVQMNDASLAALFVPDNSAVADACAARYYPSWETSSSTSASMAGCALTLAETSQVLVSGSLGVGLPASSAAVEGRFGLAYGGFAPQLSSVRYVNSYPDGGEGSEGSVATSNLLTVTPGLHTFYLVGSRYAGTGTVKAWYPVLFVLAPRGQVFVPLATK
jgi:hypothetical protein